MRIVFRIGLLLGVIALAAEAFPTPPEQSRATNPADTKQCVASEQAISSAGCPVGIDAYSVAPVSLNSSNAAASHSVPLDSEVLPSLDSLESRGEFYNARRLLKSQANANADVDTLARRARLEDWYGSDSSNAYAALMKAQMRELRPSEEVLATARRGLEVSLRSGRLDDAGIFARQLAAFGDESGRSLLRSGATARKESTTELIGGEDALQFFLTGETKRKSTAFLTDYARMLAAEQKNDVHSLTVNIREYFQQVSALAQLGERKPDEIDVLLSLADKGAKHRTEAAFKILGLKVAHEKNQLVIRSVERKDQAAKQDIVAALAVDVQAIQEALAAGKSYTLQIPVDHIAIFPAEAIWKDAFFERQQYAGGMFEAFATDQRVSRLYVALNSMERGAAETLYRATSTRALADEFSTPLSLYSAALSLDGTAAEVPGGREARASWAALVGASPADAAGFFRALMARDEGRTLAFYYTLSQLDSAHQRFFVRSPARIKRYYECFRESAEMRRGAERLTDNSSFVEFLREVPLNDDGTVDFPGSPEVWMVAKGQKNTAGSVAKLTRKMKKKSAPDDEDEILLRLARTGYKSASRERSELANFVAVCRLDAERDEPMTPEAALILAQNYSQYGRLYPYFAALGDLGAADYQEVLDLAAKLSVLDPVLANTRLGEFHSALALLAIAHRSGAASEEQVAGVFRKAVQRYSRAESAAAWTQASLDLLDKLIAWAPERALSRDEAVRDLLIGRDRNESMLLSTGAVIVNATARRRKSFKQVLQLQKAPSLDALFAIREGVAKVSNPALDRIGAGVAQLPVVPVPKGWHLAADERRAVQRFEIASLDGSLRHLKALSAKRKHNERDMERDSEQILAALEPWTELAMSSLVYAWYLQPTDLVVSEDPMLLRKHQFVNLGPASTKRDYFGQSAFFASSDAEGSYFVGGFSSFSIAAGQARAVGNHAGRSGGDMFASALFASIRGTDWQLLTDPVLQAFAARIRIGREWTVQSAKSEAMLAELREESRGLLSLTRRKMLLSAVVDRDWANVWQAVSVSDLYFLGDALSRNAKPELWGTPALQAMKKAAREIPQLEVFGQVAPDLNGCAQTHLRRYEPYEEYEVYIIPSRVAERVAELKFALAWLADSEGWPAQAIAAAAPSAADAVLKRMQLRDPRDWKSALEAYNSLKAQTVEAILSEQ